MLKLFPQYWLVPFGGVAALFVYLIMQVKSGFSLPLAVVILVVAAVILFIVANFAALAAHQDRLAWLYQNLEPERFVKMYGKLLPRSHGNPAQEVNVRAHLANAYAALGEFDKAFELLEQAPEVPGDEKERLQAKVMLLNNRATMHYQLEQVEKGKACADEMHALLEQGPEELRRRYEESERLLRCHYEALTGVCEDDKYLREVVRNSTTTLFRVNANFLLSRVYFSQGERDLGMSYLEQTIEVGRDWLWPTQKARELLESMQPEGGKKAKA